MADGNIAAMREALIQCELFLGNVSRHAHPTLNPGDKCSACDGVDELRGMVAAALSAPPEPPSNAAALRAALEAMLDEYCDLCDVQNQMTESGHNCSWRNRWSGCQSKAIDKASAALSAPAMNCGRFTNAESAIAAFRVETGIGEKPLALWLGHDIEEFAAWFFAMASQKRKEKSDGSK